MVPVPGNAIKVDLFSDTVTRPTDGMRRAMAMAEVGDEQRFEDPTTLRLEARVAELLGQPGAVLMPSGTMCNEIAYAVHCRAGDEVILDQTAHTLTAESGGPAVLARVVLRPLAGERGIFSSDQVRSAIRGSGRHLPRTRLVSIEQTSNFGGGSCWSLETIDGVVEVARDAGLLLHCDGARILNAAVATRTAAAEFGRRFDSVWLDLSKGLGAPIGAVLCGDEEFIEEAWRWKQRIGGAMRQSGVIAAAGLYALDHHVERLAEDHAGARRFADAIAEVPGVLLNPTTVETNIVIFEVDGAPGTAQVLADGTLATGVRLCPLGPNTVRAVTHLDVDADGITAAIEAVVAAMAAA
ncbi:MAG: threonine aldolase family protein [Candidatus Dormibacteria bacterium]